MVSIYNFLKRSVLGDKGRVGGLGVNPQPQTETLSEFLSGLLSRLPFFWSPIVPPPVLGTLIIEHSRCPFKSF